MSTKLDGITSKKSVTLIFTAMRILYRWENYTVGNFVTFVLHMTLEWLYQGVGDVYRGADKSSARPGRIKATETKLTFASHSKKFRRLSVQPGLCGSNELHVG